MRNVVEELKAAVSEHEMLRHPLYQSWTAGTLSQQTLRSYAAQYYRFVSAFPTFVSGVHSGCDDPSTRAELLLNLMEEEHGDENHPELWLRFCDAMGVTRDGAKSSVPFATTSQLIDTFRACTRQGTTAEGLAALYAYESQVPAVAAAKIDGLRRFYGVEAPRSISFFTVHQKLDVWHSETCAKLLERHAPDRAAAERAVEAGRAAAKALWGFLDGFPA